VGYMGSMNVMSIEAQLSREEGEALVRRGLGKYELELCSTDLERAP